MKELICSGKLDSEFYTLTQVPVRICDIGGWLDTWFAVSGKVLNFSVLSRHAYSSAPFRGVDILISKKNGNGTINIIAADPCYDIISNIYDIKTGGFDKSNLLLAAISLLSLDAFVQSDITIRIESPIPPGASMGTSAAIAVGLIKAVNQLLGEKISVAAIAELAFKAETEVMGGQSGTQDQWSAAFGLGAQHVCIDSYPETKISKVPISDRAKKKLEEGLITVFVGQHSSSAVHGKVISALEKEGEHGQRLEKLRGLAEEALGVLEKDDLVSFGNIMTKNTEAQRCLHSGLVGQYHQEVIALAKKCNCLGYKVNGAGGEGGSVSVLFKDRSAKLLFFKKAQEQLRPEYKYFEHKITGDRN